MQVQDPTMFMPPFPLMNYLSIHGLVRLVRILRKLRVLRMLRTLKMQTLSPLWINHLDDARNVDNALDEETGLTSRLTSFFQ